MSESNQHSAPLTEREWAMLSPEEQDGLIASGWHPGLFASQQQAEPLRDALRQLDGKVWHVRSGRWLCVDAENGTVTKL